MNLVCGLQIATAESWIDLALFALALTSRMAANSLEGKVKTLLDILEEVEKKVLADSSVFKNVDTKHLSCRLQRVADLLNKECNAILLLDVDEDGPDDYEDSDHEESGLSDLTEKKPVVGGMGGLAPTPSGGLAPTPSGGLAPTPPVKLAPTPPPPAIPVTQQFQPAPMSTRFLPKTTALDEPAKKRRREAENLVKQLDRPKTYNCGISYQGDQKERDFSEGAKANIKANLPALRNHRHLFHYMAWATMERLECEHCRKCTNEYR